MQRNLHELMHTRKPSLVGIHVYRRQPYGRIDPARFLTGVTIWVITGHRDKLICGRSNSFRVKIACVSTFLSLCIHLFARGIWGGWCSLLKSIVWPSLHKANVYSSRFDEKVLACKYEMMLKFDLSGEPMRGCR